MSEFESADDEFVTANSIDDDHDSVDNSRRRASRNATKLARVAQLGSLLTKPSSDQDDTVIVNNDKEWKVSWPSDVETKRLVLLAAAHVSTAFRGKKFYIALESGQPWRLFIHRKLSTHYACCSIHHSISTLCL
jgi:hypothetical protein